MRDRVHRVFDKLRQGDQETCHDLPLSEERKRHLREFGFNQIGQTDLFQIRDCGVVVDIDPASTGYNFLFNYNNALRPFDIHALTLGQEQYGQDDALQILQHEPRYDRTSVLEYSLNGSGGGVLGEEEARLETALRHISEKPITQ